jgi:hypothetical protein
MNTVHDVNMKANSSITFKQYAKNGEWAFPIEFKEGEVPAMFRDMKCLDLGEHFSNEDFGQLTLKAQPVTAVCHFPLTFKNEANGNFLTFNINVHPAGMPNGELFEAHNFEMNKAHDIHMSAHGMVTFRMYSKNGVWPFAVE